MRKVEQWVYQYEELPESAKKRARERASRYLNDTMDSDVLRSAMTTVLLEKWGIVVSKGIAYRLSHSAGDGVAFYGSLDMSVFCLRHPDIGVTWDKFGRPDVTIEKRQSFHLYDHHNTMVLDTNYCQIEGHCYENDPSWDYDIDEWLDDILAIVQQASKSVAAYGYEWIDNATGEKAVLEECKRHEYYDDGEVYDG